MKPTSAQSTSDTIEKISADLLAIQDRLSTLAWREQHVTPKETLAKVYKAQSHLCNAIVEIFTLTSK